MQAGQHFARRARVVVLHKMRIDANVLHLALIETFKKNAPLVTEYHQFNDQAPGIAVI